MRKIFIPLIFLSLLCSCKTYKVWQQERIVRKYDNIPLPSQGLLLIPVKLDGLEVPFMFDTGNGKTVLLGDAMLEKINFSNRMNFGHITAADGKKIKLEQVTTPMQNIFFASENKIVGIIPHPYSNCPDQLPFVGIFGMERLKSSIINLNFTERKLESLDSLSLTAQVLSNYELIPSKFEGNACYIELEINGRKDYYLFDTGNSSGIITKPEYLSTRFDSIFQSEGSAFQSANSRFGNESSFYQGPVSIAGTELQMPVLTISDSKLMNIGYAAIAQLDWIIDFADKKVYAKPNGFTPKVTEPPSKYYTSIEKGNIVVATRIKGHTTYQIGEKITSVNGEVVTADNICRIQQLLATTDWNTLRIEHRTN